MVYTGHNSKKILFFPNEAKAIFAGDTLTLKVFRALEARDILRIYFDCVDDALISGRQILSLHLISEHPEHFRVLSILTPIAGQSSK